MAYNNVKPLTAAQMLEKVLVDIVENERGCLISNRGKDKKGYARIGFGGRGAGTMLAHRFVYEMVKGKVPLDRPFVLHTCDTPSCINPDHLYAGTAAQNTADMMRKKRG